MRKCNFYLLAALAVSVFSLCFISCSKKAPWAGCEFYVYSMEEYDAKLYIGWNKNTLYAIIAGDLEGIVCHVHMEHKCSDSEFETALSKLDELKGTYKGTFEGTTTELDLTDYPDLSMYVTWVLSSDERTELWQSLGFEE